MVIFFRFNEYNSTSNLYEVVETIPVTECTNYKLKFEAFPKVDKYELDFIPNETIKYVPQRLSDLDILKPLIIEGIDKEDNVIFTGFVTERKYEDTEDGEMVSFECVNFVEFLERKLIIANKYSDYTGEDLPDEFAMYINNTTQLGHVQYVMANSFQYPFYITYGRESITINNDRIFKGLGNITYNLDNTIKKAINEEITDCLKVLKDVMEDTKPFVVESKLVDGKVDIHFRNYQETTENLITDYLDVIELMSYNQFFPNFIFAYGDGNNDVNVANVRTIDFTSYEVAEDISFTSGGNNTYLRNSAKNILHENDNEFIFYGLKVTSDTLVNVLKVGDIGYINDLRYVIKTIQMNEKSGDIGLDIKIERID